MRNKILDEPQELINYSYAYQIRNLYHPVQVDVINKKDYEEFLSLDRKHGGYIDNRAAQMIYNSCRIIKGLSLDAVKVMADPAYREQRAKQRQTTKPG